MDAALPDFGILLVFYVPVDRGNASSVATKTWLSSGWLFRLPLFGFLWFLYCWG